MATINASQILSNLYGLMMEINYHRSDDEVLTELQENQDVQLERHLIKIKQLSTKLKAEANKTRFQEALEYLRILKERGADEMIKLFKPQEHLKLAPLFRKFEELTEKDEKAILEDQELLQLIRILKDKINENKDS